MPSLTHEQIKSIIPHRYPMLLVDTVEDYAPGEFAVGIKNVSANEPFFQGHFPTYAVMPGVLIVEALAQTGAVALLSLPENQGKLAFFGGIKKAKFRQQVVPGDQLRLEVTLTRRIGPAGIGEAKAYVGDKVACECEITFVVAAAEE